MTATEIEQDVKSGEVVPAPVAQAAMAGWEQPEESWDYDKFVAAGREVSYRAQWLLGELAKGVTAVYGEGRLGNYADDIGVASTTLYAYRLVAARFPENSRRRELPWSVYRELVRQDDAEELIASRDDWTVSKARELVGKRAEAANRRELRQLAKERKGAAAGKKGKPGSVARVHQQPAAAAEDSEHQDLPATPEHSAAAPEPPVEQPAKEGALRQAEARVAALEAANAKLEEKVLQMRKQPGVQETLAIAGHNRELQQRAADLESDLDDVRGYFGRLWEAAGEQGQAFLREHRPPECLTR